MDEVHGLVGVSMEPGQVFFHRSGAWVKVVRDEGDRYYKGRRVFYKPESKEIGSEIDARDVVLSKSMTYRTPEDALKAPQFEGIT